MPMPDFQSKKPLKKFGQNFLTNPHYQQKIVDALNIQNTDNILEIGPGKGALTELILDNVCHRFWAVEIDRRWSEELRQNYGNKIQVIEEDFLNLDLNMFFKEADEKLKIIGNIPYNITSPILFKLIDNFRLVKTAVLMTQKEVAQRIAAMPGSKDYGILSVISQTYGQAEFLFNVKRGNFFPVPSVDSAVLRIHFFDEIRGIENADLFRQLVRGVFNYRRKMLRNSLSRTFDKSVVNSLNSVFLEARPESLSVQDFKNLANEINSITGQRND